MFQLSPVGRRGGGVRGAKKRWVWQVGLVGWFGRVEVVRVCYELLIQLRIGGFGIGTLPFGSVSGLAKTDEGAHPPSSLTPPESVLLPQQFASVSATISGSLLFQRAWLSLLWLFVTSLNSLGEKAIRKETRYSQLASRRRPGPVNYTNS